MRTCPSCGGIIGRDCFNPNECAMITHREEQYERMKASNNSDDIRILEEKFNRLCEILINNGINMADFSPVSSLDTATEDPNYNIVSRTTAHNDDDLPF